MAAVTSELRRYQTPVIEVNHVATKFGQAVVHEDVSLSIQRGEIFAIAGGNGSGKTTLLREIIGLIMPSLERYGCSDLTVDNWKRVMAIPFTADSA